MFQLTKEEFEGLKSQFATLSWDGRRTGKKWFAFSKMEMSAIEIFAGVKA